MAIKKIGFGNVVRILIVPKKSLSIPQESEFIGIVDPEISERGSATFFLDYRNMVNQTVLVTFGFGANADQL